jgi:2-methylisocitrate lyase-like PEP mutase family enzyme
LQLFRLHCGHHVREMIAELDAPVTQVRAVAIAGKRDCMYLVARSDASTRR